MTDIAYDTAGRIVCLVGPSDPVGILPPIAGRLEVPDVVADQVRPRMDAYAVADGVLTLGGEPVEIPESVPQTVPMSALRKALRRMLVNDARPELGYALPALEAYVESDGDLYDELHYSPDVARDHGTVEKLGRLFGWTDAKLDRLFRLAGTLSQNAP